jgi:DNA-binding Xre family transcriptional regulator
MKPTKEMLDTFINALQLSIKTKIISVAEEGDNVRINFAKPPSGDPKLNRFLNIFNGKWSNDRHYFQIPNASKVDWPSLKMFLQITRMNNDNILKWTDANETALEIAERIGIRNTQAGLAGPLQAARVIFDRVREKGMTIRELAEKTGLTQVALSNFKTGGDIKLSNLIKIANALGLRIRM